MKYTSNSDKLRIISGLNISETINKMMINLNHSSEYNCWNGNKLIEFHSKEIDWLWRPRLPIFRGKIEFRQNGHEAIIEICMKGNLLIDLMKYALLILFLIASVISVISMNSFEYLFISLIGILSYIILHSMNEDRISEGMKVITKGFKSEIE